MIKVLVVDDSALIRGVLTSILDEDPELEVCGVAPDAFVARERIKSLNPDVLTLDVEMPGMNGLVFLRNLMRLRPMPVVMCSTLTSRNADVTLTALELGAFDYVHKPDASSQAGLEEYATEIRAKVKAAVMARRGGGAEARRSSSGPEAAVRADAILPPPGRAPVGSPVIAIGASTGGTEALRRLFCALPADLPPIVVAQHIPESFSRAFAERLDGVSAVSVAQAEPRMRLEEGHAYVAPGGRHLMVRDEHLELSDGPKVNRHRPSVDVLFRSVAAASGAAGVGLLLTGMGDDGARGLCEMKAVGASTGAQDEASCVVFGMPRAAIERGGAGTVLALSEAAEWMVETCRKVRAVD